MENNQKKFKNQLNTYKKTEVLTANRETILLLMYAGAIRFINTAIEAHKRNDTQERGKYIGKSIEIINELKATLNFKIGGELAKNLDSLYDYVSDRLLQSNINKTEQYLNEALNVFITLNDGWEKAIESLKKKND